MPHLKAALYTSSMSRAETLKSELAYHIESEARYTPQIGALASQLPAPCDDMNQHCAWFHVMEDEVSHRGQIRLLRKHVAPGRKA